MKQCMVCSTTHLAQLIHIDTENLPSVKLEYEEPYEYIKIRMLNCERKGWGGVRRGAGPGEVRGKGVTENRVAEDKVVWEIWRLWPVTGLWCVPALWSYHLHVKLRTCIRYDRRAQHTAAFVCCYCAQWGTAHDTAASHGTAKHVQS